jgi:hypothetical protein
MRNFDTGVGATIRENLPQHSETIRKYRGGHTQAASSSRAIKQLIV